VVISFFDFIEESRNLSTVELNLRRLIIKILQRTIKERMAFWKQRSKIKFAIEGDENSKYFHAIASARYRKNKISTIEINGSEFTDHHLKMQILTAFYQQLLGQPFCPTWNFPLEQLYTSPLPNLQSLALPFSEIEITQAFFQMKSNASPGPDASVQVSSERIGKLPSKKSFKRSTNSTTKQQISLPLIEPIYF
jgi:hypothetical protein